MRKRMISPDIWSNRKLLRLDDKQKLLYIGLFSTADDYGKLWYDLLSIKASIFPCDNISEDELANSIDVLIKLKLIITDKKVIKIHGWNKHQSVPRPLPSSIPNPIIKINGNKLHADNMHDACTEHATNMHCTNNEQSPGKHEDFQLHAKERNKEKKKERDHDFSSESLEELSEKEKTLNNTRDLLLKHVYLFSNEEYNEIDKLITEFKPLQAQGKIFEKIEKANSPPN